MNKKVKIVSLIVGGLLFVLGASAQTRSFSTLLSVGASTPILDNGIGVHVGVNPSYRLTPRLSAEGQASYLYTNIGSSFLSGEQGAVHAANTLVGGRLSLSSEERKNRFFVNLLAGLNYQQERVNGTQNDGEWGVGFSGGGFVKLNRVVLGLTYDTPQNVVFKAGYAFMVDSPQR